jgi:hypothetical protein
LQKPDLEWELIIYNNVFWSNCELGVYSVKISLFLNPPQLCQTTECKNILKKKYHINFQPSRWA